MSKIVKKNNKQPLYEVLPDYIFEQAPEIQARIKQAEESGEPKPQFFFVRLLSPQFRNWVINLEDIPNKEDPSQPPRIGYSVYRVPSEVSDEEIFAKQSEIQTHMTKVIQNLVKDAINTHKKNSKKK